MRPLKACSFCCRRYLHVHKRNRFLSISDLMQQGFSHPCSMSSSKVRREVVISLSEDIHTNLALEDWLYERADLEARNILLMWRNEPAIVIGRHQNPWLECNVPEAKKQGISLVRRKSGGGTVYHDKGNLNCSVLTNRKMYNRKENLELIVKAIQSKWDVPLTVNSRDDIMMDGMYKISGTAAKLGGKRAYHHFTLLFDADLDKIPSFLQSPVLGSDTKATASVPSPVRNLTEADHSVDFDSLTSAIAEQYLGKQVQASQLRYLSPTEEEFPGIDEKIRELRDPSWMFNKTPKFSVVREFAEGDDTRLKIDVQIDKGRITQVEFSTSGMQCAQAQLTLTEIQNYLTEQNVNSQLVTECVERVERKAEILPQKEKIMLVWIVDCVKKLFNFC